MAKGTSFTAYDLQRKESHKLACPPVKVRFSQLDAREWSRATKDRAAGSSNSGKISRPRRRVSKKQAASKLPKRATDVLRSALAASESPCLHCGNFGDDKNCGPQCYRDFKKQFIGSQIDIRGPGPHGYGAFTTPDTHLSKGQYLDEYIGDLRPLESEEARGSLYCFTIPNVCVVDAKRAGNWTRFVNSSCRPNVVPWAGFVGGRHIIAFQALKDIGPEQELVFNYGKMYFKNAGLECSCDAGDAPHAPGKGKRSRWANRMQS